MNIVIKYNNPIIAITDYDILNQFQANWGIVANGTVRDSPEHRLNELPMELRHASQTVFHKTSLWDVTLTGALHANSAACVGNINAFFHL